MGKIEQQLRAAIDTLNAHPNLPRPGSIGMQCYTQQLPVVFTFAGMPGLHAVGEWAAAYNRPVEFDWFDVTHRIEAQADCGPIQFVVPWLDRRELSDLPWPGNALAEAVQAAELVNDHHGARRYDDKIKPTVEPGEVLAAFGAVLVGG